MEKQDTTGLLSEDKKNKQAKKHFQWLFAKLKLLVISIASSNDFNLRCILIQKKMWSSSAFDIWNYADCLAYFKTYQRRQASVFDKFLHKMYCKKQVKGKVSINYFIKFKWQMHRITVGVLTPCRILNDFCGL